MNEFQIGAMPVAGGYIAWIRKVHRAENEPIKGKGGQPIVYATRAEAKAAAGEAMVAYLNGPEMRRDGAKLEATSAADALFPKLEPSRPEVIRQSKTKRLVEVVRG